MFQKLFLGNVVFRKFSIGNSNVMYKEEKKN